MRCALLKVTNAAVHELRAAAGSAFGKIMLLHQQRAVPARSRVDADAETCRSPADHEEIPGPSVILNLVQYCFAFHGRSFIFRSSCSGLFVELSAFFFGLLDESRSFPRHKGVTKLPSPRSVAKSITNRQ